VDQVILLKFRRMVRCLAFRCATFFALLRVRASSVSANSGTFVSMSCVCSRRGPWRTGSEKEYVMGKSRMAAIALASSVVLLGLVGGSASAQSAAPKSSNGEVEVFV